MKDLPVRKKIRLKDYDYSQNGCYFVTVCVKDRYSILWDAAVGAVCGRPQLSPIGIIVEAEIQKMGNVYLHIHIDKYIIMPNHIHMIIRVDETDGRPQTAPTISWVVNMFKGSVSKQIGESIWQRSYHDHIIRNETGYQHIWQYIDTNPAQWTEDCYYK